MDWLELIKKNEKKIKGLPVYWESPKGGVVMLYSQFDLGSKYKIYKKNDFGLWVYVYAEDSIIKAVNYAKKIHE